MKVKVLFLQTAIAKDLLTEHHIANILSQREHLNI